MTKKANTPEKKLSIKQFLIESVCVYPLWFFLIVSDFVEKNHWQEFEIYFNVGIFLFFSALNWILAQKRIPKYLLLLHIIVLIWYGSSFPLIEIIPEIEVMTIIILYAGLIPIILFAQFFTWIPFLIKFLYQNRKSIDNLPFD